MPMPYSEIIDRHGRKRRARPGEVLKDGERFFFSMMMMDDDGRIRDGYGLPAGHRRGFAFAADHHARDAAAEAYEARNERLRTGYLQNRGPVSSRPKQQQQFDDRSSHSLEDAQALADDAYRAKVSALDYRNRRHAP